MNLTFNFIKSVSNIYDEMIKNGFSLVYLGEFSHEITKMFTSMAETDMEKQSEERSVQRKVYHVMVETLQNMNKHSDEIRSGNIGSGLFIIGKKNETYYVITSNVVARKHKADLEDALNTVNNATKDELKEMYKKQIKEGRMSKKGGAGLGLIDIVRKTGEKINYHFLQLDEKNFFFILKVEINAKKFAKEAY
ncbi:MAG: SiaB family protein kinase [Bacteroidales bacterium]|nr:SiaB family protein kinase [Bacteroidales bacterium]MDD4673466.1 SiaB family protein kinase [Bacteroidales bacterium]MDY0349578.1 SiaB family protein kinase [Tenuifilaceae bacterium]